MFQLTLGGFRYIKKRRTGEAREAGLAILGDFVLL
jgi:hypothetical protein